MLQKILVVLVGLVMSLVGALSPTGLFASKNANDALGIDAASATDQTLATVRSTDSTAFAKLSILWVQNDGREVTEDAWGTGEIKELKFKIGVKDVDGLSLKVGDKMVPLHPTDVITVRMFNGDFAYRNLGTSAATLQLQGTVKTTLLNAGSPTGKLQTATGGLLSRASDQSSSGPRPVGDVQRIAFVTLSTGQQQDTVDVANGGARLLTAADDAAATASSAPSTSAGNMLVKWVKIDGKAVSEYTWGDGSVERIEFQAAVSDANAPLLNFDSKGTTAPAGAHVLVRNFTGEYLVYQVAGGGLRMRLDGYAEQVTTGAEGGLPIMPSTGGLLPAFEVEPQPARTTDVLQFHDRSSADGVVVYWKWSFGDGTSAALQEPTHRYARPGVYNVTLNITDSDLNAVETTRQVIVNNADPIPDYDVLPHLLSTDTLASFTDHSLDPDGVVVNWTWHFGDGTVSNERHPNHRFVKSGNLPVSLTVTDDLGGQATLTKTLNVRNSPPLASFEYSPQTMILAGMPVHFHSTSVDKDGTVVDARWSFGAEGSAKARGSDVTYAFPHPGSFDVALTATDDAGDSNTVTTQIVVINQPPVPDFTYAPTNITANVMVTFDGRASSDADGFIVLNEWTFGDGTGTEISRAVDTCTNNGPLNKDCQDQLNTDKQVDPFQVDTHNTNLGYQPPPGYAPPPPVTHKFAHRGTYNVTLCVTDNLLAKSCETVGLPVNNSAPIVHIGFSPSDQMPRNNDTLISDQSTDPDGDPHTVLRWVFDGVTDPSVSPTLVKNYPSLGVHTITLYVQDALGAMNSGSRNLSIVNVGPVIDTFNVSDIAPPASVPVTFSITAHDPDSNNPLSVVWTFSDGTVVPNVLTLNHTFLAQGDAFVQVYVNDTEGGHASKGRTMKVHVSPPIPDFTWAASEPTTGDNVTFNDTSQPTTGPITKWVWDFGDHSTFTTTDPAKRNVTHRYATPCDSSSRTCTVSLTISSTAQPDVQASHTFHVNSPPTADFAFQQVTYEVNQPVTFTDLSTDPDGQNTIDHRVWDFGDGTLPVTWNDSTITHTFMVPGTHSVKQTVVDDHGATASLSKLITIGDAAPVARWIVDPTTQVANLGTQFTSAGYAYDPDGNSTIAYWSWDFGDGSPAYAGTDAGVYQNPVHAFASSGLYRVSLVVGDGNKLSDAYAATVRIAADHAITFLLNATLPSGQYVNLLGPGYSSDLITQPIAGAPSYALHQRDLVPDPQGATFTLPARVWVGASNGRLGDSVQVQLTVTLPGYTGYLSKNFNLADTDGKPDPVTGITAPVRVDFLVPLPLQGNVGADPDNDAGLIVPNGPAYDGGTVYHSLTGGFHGRGHIEYVDGSPTDLASATVQLRFIPLYTPGHEDKPTIRDSITLDNPILGWCIADQTTTDAAGNFTWSTDHSSCLLQPTLNAPGHWEVRVIAAREGVAKPFVSKPSEFFVDPTGLLASIYMP